MIIQHARLNNKLLDAEITQLKKGLHSYQDGHFHIKCLQQNR